MWPTGRLPQATVGRDSFLSTTSTPTGPAPSLAPSSQKARAIFARIDGRLPRPTDWTSGPGGVRPDPRPWAVVAKNYAFIDQLAELRFQVKCPGNLERFDYWLDQFRYMKEAALACCRWHRFNEAMSQVKGVKAGEERKKQARELVLPRYRELLAAVAGVQAHLLASVSTPGGLGTVANWQQHNMPDMVFKPGRELAAVLETELPLDAQPSRDDRGKPRIFVPVVRTGLIAGESLTLDVVVLGARPSQASISWRQLDERNGPFASVPLSHRGEACGRLPSRRRRPRTTSNTSSRL